MSGLISPRRIATLVEGFDRDPAYLGLTAALRLAIGDGRVPFEAKLPSERDLTAELGVSRTTVTRAYALLVEQGYATARRGAGTFARVPGGRRRASDRALTPAVRIPHADGRTDRGGLPEEGHELIDLVCAACPAPEGIAEAYAAATEQLPAYLGGHGYFPTAVPALAEMLAQRYTDEGLVTDPDQILIVPGALAGTAVAASALLAVGDRALVDTPVYPNAVQALRRTGARIATAPVDRDGWDLDAYAVALRQAAPRAAYLIPDFQNPTGHLLDARGREIVAAALAAAHATPIVDESLRALHLDRDAADLPPRMAELASEAITIGSASKTIWGGLRLGWLRLPHRMIEPAIEARLGLDLGNPVLEQLVLVDLLRDGAAEVAQRQRMRTRRDHLVATLRRELPEWRFTVPGGGLVLWCELPVAAGTRLAEAALAEGVAIAAGPQFAVGGGLDRFVRLPYVRPEADLDLAVERLARAWARVRTEPAIATGSRGRGTRVVA